MYLENNLAADTFTPKRVELLNLLSSQMAMALDNARLYNNLEVEVTAQTKELLQAKETAESANRTKSIFLTTMSHELRSPLNAILGFTTMLAHDLQATSVQRERIAVINRSGVHLLAIINDVLEVVDTGPGIDPAFHQRIFDPFIQAKGGSPQAGAGLGLSISKENADLMGGRIEVESEVEKGSLFRVRLPAGIAAATKALTQAGPRVIGLANGQAPPRILVVDDNLDNLLVLTSLLEDAGFSVLQVENGKAALDLFEKGASDFIWMDMRMPVMDGYEAVRQIRQRPGGDTLPIVALTASTFKQQRRKILDSGCDDMVIKHFREHEIFETMDRFLEIEYVYDQEAEPAPTTGQGADLTPAMLAELPPQFLRDLDETTLVLDMDAIREVIERIAEQAPDTARQLQALAQDFEVTRIRELLEGPEERRP